MHRLISIPEVEVSDTTGAGICTAAGQKKIHRLVEIKKGRLLTSHRYNRLPLLPSGPGGVQQELAV